MNAPTTLSQVSVVITHYRATEDLTKCLALLRRVPGAHQLDVLVADSDAQAGTEELVHRILKSARHLPFDWNCGYAALVNNGLIATSRPFVLVINADIALTPETIPTLLAHLQENPDVGIVAPAVSHSSGDPQTTAFSFYRPSTILYRRTPLGRTRRGRAELDRFELSELSTNARSAGAPVDVDWLMGAVMLVRRSAILDTGPLDERYFLYFEDVDWCLQFWRHGWRVVYLPTVSCTHTWSRASQRGGILGLVTNPLARRHLKSGLRFFIRNGVHCGRPSSVATPTPVGVSTASIPLQTGRGPDGSSAPTAQASRQLRFGLRRVDGETAPLSAIAAWH